MRRHAAALALTIVLVVQLACTSTLGVLKATFHPDTVALMKLPESERQCAEALFASTHSALLAYEADRTAGKWAVVREAAAQFEVRQCSQNQTFLEVVALGQRILVSVEPPRTRSWASQSQGPDFGKVDKRAVEELKKKVEGLKGRRR